MIKMRAIFLLASLITITAIACAEETATERSTWVLPPLAKPNSATQNGARLQLSSRREGLIAYVPNPAHIITIRAPESALQQGWRCCWIEAYSAQTAKALSNQYGKPVQGNAPDVSFDSVRTEASLRQIAPSTFQGYLALGSAVREGSHVLRLYVHLYWPINSDDDGQDNARSRHRIARNFLDEPTLNVQFMYSPQNDQPGTTGTRHPPVPSQLPQPSLYTPPR